MCAFAYFALSSAMPIASANAAELLEDGVKTPC